MFNSDDCRRENKTKNSKNECVKNNIVHYMQKRNLTFKPTKLTKSQFQLYLTVDREISAPNSILYSCCNYDPSILDNHFSKFLTWLRGLNVDIAKGISEIIGPLFCHLYFYILQGSQPAKAADFFRNHLSNVDNLNQDPEIQKLIRSLSPEIESEVFRTSRYVVQMSEESKQALMNFVANNCHVIFLQVLQTWFEIEVMCSELTESEGDLVPNECCRKSKFNNIISAALELEKSSNKCIFSVDVSNVVSDVNCGIISRYHGLFLYNQENIIHIHPLHTFNNLSCSTDSKMIKLNAHSTKIYAMCISRNYFVSASCDGKITIFSNENFQMSQECSGHTRTVYCLKISSNELYLASGSEDTTLRLWNVGSGQLQRIFVGHSKAIVSCDFHPNCLYLFSGSSDNSIRMWNIETANSLRLFHGAQGTIRSVICHPQGSYFASASDDKYLRIWDILNNKLYSETKCRDGFISKLQWNKDGTLLCAALSNKSIKIWKYEKLEDSGIRHPEVLLTLNCGGTVLSLEYCFGTFGILTTKCIPAGQ